MKQKLTLLLCFSIACCFGYAQDEITIYKKLFVYADSIANAKQKGVVSEEAKNALKELDKNHPAGYFDKASTLLKEGNYNDASFLYYVGYFRYSYYNSANPDYKASEDGALAGSLKYVMGEPVNLFLKADIDNYIGILTQAKEWLVNHDYVFFAKQKNVEKYNLVISKLDELMSSLSANKEKYKTAWATEQAETRKAIADEMKQKKDSL